MDNDYLPDPAEERSQRRFKLLNLGRPTAHDIENLDPVRAEAIMAAEEPPMGFGAKMIQEINADNIDRLMARPDANPKSAFGIKKPSMHLIPGTALMMLAKVMALGASKYGAYNWRDQPVAATVYLSAALRHIYQWLDGEDIDPESGAPHLAHAMADMAILLDAFANNTLIDDRPNTRSAQTTRIINELTVKD